MADPLLHGLRISTFGGSKFYEWPRDWTGSSQARFELLVGILAPSKSGRTLGNLGCDPRMIRGRRQVATLCSLLLPLALRWHFLWPLVPLNSCYGRKHHKAPETCSLGMPLRCPKKRSVTVFQPCACGWMGNLFRCITPQDLLKFFLSVLLGLNLISSFSLYSCTIVFTTEKKPCVSGPVQFKPMLFKGWLYFINTGCYFLIFFAFVLNLWDVFKGCVYSGAPQVHRNVETLMLKKIDQWNISSTTCWEY